jgi:hypothetical protein
VKRRTGSGQGSVNDKEASPRLAGRAHAQSPGGISPYLTYDDSFHFQENNAPSSSGSNNRGKISKTRISQPYRNALKSRRRWFNFDFNNAISLPIKSMSCYQICRVMGLM